MKKAIKIYDFEVMDKIKEGKEVYCIDRFLTTIKIVRSMKINEFAKIKNHENDDNRYEFYYIGDSEEKDGLDL